jgi:four helix bundle protein
MADVIRSHRDLVVWQKAMDLAEQVYSIAAQFPRQEMYRLVDQMTRAVVSVPANLAEGHARVTRKDYAHFVSIAQGSLAETETYLLLTAHLNYATDARLTAPMALLTEVSKMLNVLRLRLTRGRVTP